MNLGDAKRHFGRIVQKLTQPPIVVKRDDQEQMPGAFIIGAPRSGTTLLRYLFDSHPIVASPPETHIFVPLLSALDDKRSIDCMWNMGFHRDSVAGALGDCCRVFLEGYAKSKGKSFWIEKTPNYTSIIPKLHEAFGNVKFIMLYRHPLEIVNSMMGRDMIEYQPDIIEYRKKYSSDLEAYCVFVSDQQKAMLDFQRKNPDVTFAVKYENITDNPDVELKKMCEFLDLGFDPAMIKFDDVSHDTGGGDLKILQTRGINPSKKNRSNWTPERREEAFSYFQDVLPELGYTD